jgi:hypothetical protein
MVDHLHMPSSNPYPCVLETTLPHPDLRLDTAAAGRDNEVVRIDQYSFGSIRIDGVTYERDVVIADGRVSERKKGPSRALRDTYGHTPLSAGEAIPWECERLVVGTGASGSLPILDEVREEAVRRGVELVTLPTREAMSLLGDVDGTDTNAILHLTC